MTAATAIEAPVSAQLRELAQVVRHLVPDRCRPEQFHEQKSELEKALRRIAAELERSPR